MVIRGTSRRLLAFSWTLPTFLSTGHLCGEEPLMYEPVRVVVGLALQRHQVTSSNEQG